MTSEALQHLYIRNKEIALFGRYITVSMIDPLLKKIALKFDIDVIGQSVEGRSIHSIKVGSGSTKVLLWSQMHGNESTTTKALFDLLNCFHRNEPEVKNMLQFCTLLIIPILNPDGAKNYTRVNANSIDLNRDAQDQSQPESRVLRTVFDEFKPDFCFNLHGQRTIFGAGKTGNSATLSFLAPAMDAEKSLPAHRKSAMSVIANLHAKLNPELNDAIGLYDDGFNINCVGDTFQNLGASTILFEAGHYSEDYHREDTRKYIFHALYYALTHISGGVGIEEFENYFKIPKNQVCFYDVLIKKAKLSENNNETVDIGIQFKEVLNNDEILFIPEISKIGNLKDFFGHKTIDAKNAVIKNQENMPLRESNEIDFVMLNNRKFLIKS